MAEKEKPIRQMDAVLIRVPDGMKERITQRARANGRSVNAELVAIIAKALGAPDEIAVRDLKQQRDNLLNSEYALLHQIEELQRRRFAVEEEIEDLVTELETLVGKPSAAESKGKK